MSMRNKVNEWLDKHPHVCLIYLCLCYTLVGMMAGFILGQVVGGN